MSETLPQYKSPAIDTSTSPDAIPLAWIVDVLKAERRILVLMICVGGVLSIALALTKSPSYTATVSFLPQTTQNSRPSGIANLADQFGINLGSSVGGGAQPPQFYADLLKTRTILGPIAEDSVPSGEEGISRVPFTSFLRISVEGREIAHELAIESLRRGIIATSVEARTTGIITSKVTTRSPRVSLQIAQRLIDELNRYNRETRQSQASAERRFIEGRLADARQNLRAAEEAMRVFLQSNRTYAVSPQLVQELASLQRELSLREQMVLGLAQQNEDARIREVRDTPVISVIDEPTLPVQRDPMGRLRTAFMITLASLLLTLVVVMARAGIHWQRAREHGHSAYVPLIQRWPFEGVLHRDS